MAKRKNKTVELNLILKCVGLIFGVAALLFAFLNCVTYTGKLLGSEASLTGFQIIFGFKETGSFNSEIVHCTFSIMNLLAFVLPLIGGVLLLFKNKILNFASVLCFVVGAVLLFLVPSFVVTELYVVDLYTSALAVGAILSAISAILGALVAGYITFTSK